MYRRAFYKTLLLATALQMTPKLYRQHFLRLRPFQLLVATCYTSGQRQAAVTAQMGDQWEVPAALKASRLTQCTLTHPSKWQHLRWTRAHRARPPPLRGSNM